MFRDKTFKLSGKRWSFLSLKQDIGEQLGAPIMTWSVWAKPSTKFGDVVITVIKQAFRKVSSGRQYRPRHASRVLEVRREREREREREKERGYLKRLTELVGSPQDCFVIKNRK